MSTPESKGPRTEEGAQSSAPISVEDFARTGRLTPMLKQYLDIKRTHPDCLLFFRLGDFYECFFEDAHTASEVLDITLTGRGKGEDRFSMAGIPHHAARSYIGRLVEAGHKVAICDQVEDASEAKGLVRREVVQIVTPGMVIDDELLDPRTERLVGAVALTEEDGAGGALALLDVSTGSFRVARLIDDVSLSEELLRSSPAEIVFSEETGELRVGALTQRLRAVAVGRREAGFFSPRDARERLCRHFGVSTLAGFGVPDGAEGALISAAAGALFRYASEAQRERAIHVDKLEVFDPGAYLVLDASTTANLEVLATLHGGRKAGSLLGLMDKTATAMGGRKLRQWLARPLTDIGSIERRQEAVAALAGRPSLSEELFERLRGMLDIERVLGRLALGHGNPRDLRGLERSLAAVPGIREELARGLGPSAGEDILGGESSSVELLEASRDALDDLPELSSLLDRALVDDPPATHRDGGLVRQGYDARLDELVDLATHGKDHLLRIETEERAATGIGSLKVRYNRVFGYYIEVSKANLRLVPEHYVRKQTMVNAERFVTPQLQDWEEKVVTAEEKRRLLEIEVFEELRRQVLAASAELGSLAEAVAELDAILCLARIALALDWRRPELDRGRDLLIEDGRHPVVEAALRKESGEPYVPSDVTIHGEKPLTIVTGPNMAGKSTVMRMAALVVLLAHVGSFVPARRAKVGLCDRIFTRVGASDDLAGGRSTFMVEMTESAAILNQATEKSLVILDEIGRGTSTFDGLSIAWAVAEDLHDRVRCRTMFATHYHELTDLAKERDGVVNFTVAVREWNEKVIFLRRLVPGAANRSYGIQVARLAGLPKGVLDRAAQVLSNLESVELDESGRPALARAGQSENRGAGQLSLFAPKPTGRHAEAIALLSDLDPDTLSPREALDLIYQLRSLLRP